MNNILKYKGYTSEVGYSVKDKVLYGKIDGIDDLVTFESDSASSIEQEFQSAVDDYLAYCQEVGKSPEKVYKGSFNIRIRAELHRSISVLSQKKGVSMNELVETAIAQYVKEHTKDATVNNWKKEEKEIGRVGCSVFGTQKQSRFNNVLTNQKKECPV